MNQGTTPQSDRRPGVGQAPERSSDGSRYAPGHTLSAGAKGRKNDARFGVDWGYFRSTTLWTLGIDRGGP